MNRALKIQAVGMFSGLARNAEANCAAMRLGYDCFQQTQFRVPSSYACINGAVADADNPVRGLNRLAHMLTQAVEDALVCCPIPLEQLGLIRTLICLPDTRKPFVDPELVNRFHALFRSQVEAHCDPNIEYIDSGPLGVLDALSRARQLLESGEASAVMIGGVDSLLTTAAISYYGGNLYGENCRLLTEDNADGFIPGEAAATMILTWAQANTSGLFCTGLGYGTEPAAYGSGQVTRAEGMVTAINAALKEGGVNMPATDYHISNVNGERYFFEEDALAIQRVLRPPKAEYPLWHPADSIGHIGAAFGPVMVASAFWAAYKSYAPGPRCLCVLSDDEQRRAAFLLEYR